MKEVEFRIFTFGFWTLNSRLLDYAVIIAVLIIHKPLFPPFISTSQPSFLLTFHAPLSSSKTQK